MIDLRISFHKIVMHLFFLLAIFYSFTDEDPAIVTLNTFENNGPEKVTTADTFIGNLPKLVNLTGNN